MKVPQFLPQRPYPIQHTSEVDNEYLHLNNTGMRSFLFIMAVVASYSATAQEQVPPVCWLAGLQFSPGIATGAKDQVVVCSPEGIWKATDKPASGCFHEGKYFSIGAVKAASRSGNKIDTRCGTDGSWAVLNDEK